MRRRLSTASAQSSADAERCSGAIAATAACCASQSAVQGVATRKQANSSMSTTLQPPAPAFDRGVLARSGRWGYAADDPNVACQPYRALDADGAGTAEDAGVNGPSNVATAPFALAVSLAISASRNGKIQKRF